MKRKNKQPHVHPVREGSPRRDKLSRVHNRAGVVRFEWFRPPLTVYPATRCWLLTRCNGVVCVSAIYEKLINSLHEFCPIRIEPKKTSILLGNRFGFAGVLHPEKTVNLEAHLNYQVMSPRVQKVEQASANRFHHIIKLTNPTDVDDELLELLRDAYELKK